VTELSLCYLGAAGWRIRAGDASLLIDPYFTRLSMRAMLFGKARPDIDLIRRSTPPADAILVTHPHYDHMMDVPEAARLTAAMVYASPQGTDLLELLGTPARQLCPIHPGNKLACGPFEIEVYASAHRLILGGVPYAGPLRRGLRPPLRAADYRIDVQFSLRITVGGLRVLLASGIRDEPPVEAEVLLVGADAGQEQLATILRATKPRCVMPNHWDDMFAPLNGRERPMITPPAGPIPSLKRIDLAAFARLVKQLQPGCEVILPKRFQPIRLPCPE
jgi:L-ascorbate metabolism protein UlaG (beta-lactamase superfamily)